MKKQLNIKKLILLNLPYILMGLFSTNFGEAWRMAVGADASAKMLSFFSTLPMALTSWWPSLHPLDLLVGLCCGGGLRLAVYLKSKNAKKYRHGMEYGSARWGTILVECGKMLQRGAPKLGKDGKPMKDKHGKVIYEPYRIKVLNTINFKKSMHYNRATCSPLKRRRTALFQSVL